MAGFIKASQKQTLGDINENTESFNDAFNFNRVR
jgi:hypothetical protein